MDTTYGNQGPYFSVDESVRHMAGSPLEPFALPGNDEGQRPPDEMMRFSPILHLNDTGKSMSEPTLDSRATSVVSPASQSYARRNSRFAAKKRNMRKSDVELHLFPKDPFRGATRMKSARVSARGITGYPPSSHFLPFSPSVYRSIVLDDDPIFFTTDRRAVSSIAPGDRSFSPYPIIPPVENGTGDR